MIRQYEDSYCLFCQKVTPHCITVLLSECKTCGRFAFKHPHFTAYARGFSLVETMIVVAIISILLTVAIPNVARARQNAEDTRTTAELNSIYTAIVTFQASNNFRLPTSWDELKGYISISNVEQKYELNPGG